MVGLARSSLIDIADKHVIGKFCGIWKSSFFYLNYCPIIIISFSSLLFMYVFI